MNKLYIVLILLFNLAFVSQSQNISDAVRYSFLNPTGTAGASSLGNAIGAMGGDFSVAGINPAGIAEYRKSAFTFTPSVNNVATDAFLVGDGSIATREENSFLLDNASFIISDSGNKWATTNWVLGFNKLASFNRDIKIEGATEGTIAERFLERAEGLGLDDLDDFEAGPAFDAGVIFQDENDNYISDFFDDDIIGKDQFIEQKGSINEITIGWAGNSNEKFNLGFVVGFPFVSFTENKTYKERFSVPEFNSELDYIETLNTTGTGINIKLGAQYRANRRLRLGIALHSPTRYRLNDNFSSSISYQFAGENTSGIGSAESPEGNFRYRLITPWKAIGSVGTVYKIGKIKGFLNADIEFINYGNNEFDFSAFSDDPEEIFFSQEVNEDIANELGSITNFRIGTEIALNVLRLRVGYNLIGSPYETETTSNSILSAGLGYRGDGFFIDLAYAYSSFEEGFNPYTLSTRLDRNPLSNITTTAGRFSATIGFTF